MRFVCATLASAAGLIATFLSEIAGHGSSRWSLQRLTVVIVADGFCERAIHVFVSICARILYTDEQDMHMVLDTT